MISVLFPDAACFTYDLCGKFQSPSPEWMHLTRNLVNFELMVVTEGTLFIADERRSYEVHPGEYLLLPPTVHQHGSKKANPVGVRAVQEIYSGRDFYHCMVGVVMTNSRFTKNAVTLANELNILLWDGNMLDKLLL